MLLILFIIIFFVFLYYWFYCSDECCEDNKKTRNTIVALLELDNPAGIDINIRNTLIESFKYLDYQFPIINVSASTIRQILDEQYKRGIRIFIGFSRSTLLNSIKDWFQQHPDAVAISCTSTAPQLNLQDNIIRLVPNDSNIITLLKYFLNEYASTKRIVLYQKDDLYAQYFADALSAYSPVAISLLADNNIVLNYLSTTDYVVPIFVEQMQQFRDLLSQHYGIVPPFKPKPLVVDILDVQPPEGLPASFVDKYKFLGNYNFVSLIATQIFQTTNGECNFYAYDAALIALYLQENHIKGNNPNLVSEISLLVGITGGLELDAGGDRKPIAYSYYNFKNPTNNEWDIETLFIVDKRFTELKYLVAPIEDVII